MSKFKVGDKVLVLISQQVTTVQAVFDTTLHNGVLRRLYQLEGRPATVLYLDEDLELQVDTPVKPRKSTYDSPPSSTSTKPVDDGGLAAAVIYTTVLYDDYHTPSYEPSDSYNESTPSWSGDSCGSSSDSSDSGGSSSDSGGSCD